MHKRFNSNVWYPYIYNLLYHTQYWYWYTTNTTNMTNTTKYNHNSRSDIKDFQPGLSSQNKTSSSLQAFKVFSSLFPAPIDISSFDCALWRIADAYLLPTYRYTSSSYEVITVRRIAFHFAESFANSSAELLPDFN
ncbi:hypothetical protein OCU04_000563 [Sclerotinia nivalis]|uniref:Uncharacterized protein n=1 Tax=Sclerotinia nivalis TaxID=352851 RepID=A0A9X0DNJ1_9HELO|nr:hypothetical protein OCU04_000563 [Sclerotinia nivalis]